MTVPDIDTYAGRLYAACIPFAAVDDNGDFAVLCEGIGAMYQAAEDLGSDYSVLLDIDLIAAANLGYLAQFVGQRLRPGLSDDDQRAWIKSLGGFARGRPATAIAALQSTLTGAKKVTVRERDGGSAFRQTIVTKSSETPNLALSTAVLMDQKPGPDIFNFEQHDYVDYEWLRTLNISYNQLKTSSTLTSYSVLKGTVF